jgi:hypothetical protein
LTMLSGMVNLTTNTSTSVIGCFKTSSPMIISNMKTGLGTCLVWVGNAMALIENRFNL